jgi:hypothetical protein
VSALLQPQVPRDLHREPRQKWIGTRGPPPPSNSGEFLFVLGSRLITSSTE